MNAHPTAVSADKGRRVLTIVWDNGMAVEYPFQLLADNCRCANCNEERAALAERGERFVAKSSELLSIEPVGSYALSIVWKGGCRFGIFTWEYLGGDLLAVVAEQRRRESGSA